MFVRFVLFFLLPPNWEGLKYTANASPISAHFNCLIVMATRWVLGPVKPEMGCRGKRGGAVILMYPKQVWGCNKKGVYQLVVVMWLVSQPNMGELCYVVCVCANYNFIYIYMFIESVLYKVERSYFCKVLKT